MMLRKGLGRLSTAAGFVFRPFARRRELAASIEALRIQTEQLVAIERLNVEQEADIRQLDALLDRDRIAAHIRTAVTGATLHLDPFPHVVIENWLPANVYRTMIRAIPPAVFFADRPPLARHRLTVPFDFGPRYARRVWRFMADEIVAGALGDALGEKFAEPMREYIRTFCPRWFEEPDQRLRVSDGRIMLRRPGYVIEPHRDPKWGFLTALIYLVRDGDNEAYGTQLYRVRDDHEATDDKPLRFEPSRCELVKAVPFRANTLLAFLNSSGAHGASIPADAMPPTLERYLYQVRLGPPGAAIKRMVSLMDPEHRVRWAGKKVRKATGEETPAY